MLHSQNLVPNYSFENYTSCPIGNQFYKLTPWCGLGGGEDSFNACFNIIGPGGNGVPNHINGWQYPRTGNGFGSVLLKVESSFPSDVNRREYLHVPLTDTLLASKSYCGKMYVNLINTDKYTTDRIGMYFSAAPYICNQAFPTPQTIAPLNVIPQVANPLGNFIMDTLNWIEVSGVFTATGTEAYLTIGNFYDDANSATTVFNPSAGYLVIYFLIDDVSVEEVFPAFCTKDTTLCAPGNILLSTDTVTSAEYSWSPTAGLSCTNCPNPTAYVNQTTTYTLTKKQCKAITTASITVTVKNDCNVLPNPHEIPNIFTPNGDNVNDAFKIELPGSGNVSFAIYNRWGNLILEVSSRASATELLWDGRTTSGEPCSEGVYFYTLKYTDANGEQQTKNGYVSLFR